MAASNTLIVQLLAKACRASKRHSATRFRRVNIYFHLQPANRHGRVSPYRHTHLRTLTCETLLTYLRNLYGVLESPRRYVYFCTL